MVKLGWGIAGCGWVARDYAAPAIAASRNGRIVALHDPKSAAMTSLRNIVPGAATATDLDVFLCTPGLQAIYVAAPNHVHRPLVEAAAQAGLAVLCEKPMATNLADARAMIACCTENEVPYATAFDQRFHAAHREIARLVADGAVGQVTAVRIVYACWVDANWSADNWRIDARRAGGGAAFDLAPHGLDLAAMLIDDTLTDIAAVGQARVHAYAGAGGIDDGAVLIARSRRGVLVQLHVAYNCPENLPRRRLEVIGTAGQIVAVDTMGQTPGGTVYWQSAGGGQPQLLTIPGDDISPFVNQIETFAACVLDGKPFPYTPEHDLQTMSLLHAAQSHITRQLSSSRQTLDAL